MRLLKKLLLVLTPKGAAAFLAGGGTFGSFDELAAAWRKAHKQEQKRVAAAYVPRDHGLYRAKKILLALMAVGAAAYFMGDGTFASFSAETSNAGSSIASGTLTMTNTVNGGTTCFSYNGVGNVNPNCSAVLTLGNLAPGTFGGTTTGGVAVSGSSQIVVANTGSIDAAKFYLYAPQVTGTASANITDNATASATIGGSVAVGATSITLASGLANALSLGTQVTLSGTSETVTLTADAAQSATTLSVSPTQFAHTTSNTVTYPIPFNIPVNALQNPIGAGQQVIVKQSTHSDILYDLHRECRRCGRFDLDDRLLRLAHDCRRHHRRRLGHQRQGLRHDGEQPTLRHAAHVGPGSRNGRTDLLLVRQRLEPREPARHVHGTCLDKPDEPNHVGQQRQHPRSRRLERQHPLR